jgi:hypothetical protein
MGAGCGLALLLAGLSSAQAAPPRITDGRHQAGDIDPGVYMTTQHGCGTHTEFNPDVQFGVGIGHWGGTPTEPAGPRYLSVRRNPFVVAYVFTGGCTWSKVRPIPKVPDTSP